MTKFKKSAFAFSTACALCLTGGIAAMKAVPVGALGETRGYYGTKLAENTDYAIATAFYDELVLMATDPDGEGTEKSKFAQGISHTVTAQAIRDEAIDYAAGSDVLAKQFGAALDSFRFDYADLYYVDFDLLAFNVEAASTGGSGESGGTGGAGSETGSEENTVALSDGASYTVEIGAGRAASYFTKGITAENFDTQNALYETNYNEIFAKVKTALGSPSDFTGISVSAKADAVNRVICEEVKYGYEPEESGKAEFVDTIYGAAVYQLADSEGLARLFKKMMNDLGETCELVSGYYLSDGATASRTWNYVKDGSAWYAVDVAGNLLNKKTVEAEEGGVSETHYNQYLYLGGELFNLEHFADAVISVSRYKMPYPELTVNRYNVNSGNLKIENGTYTYTTTGGEATTDETGDTEPDPAPAPTPETKNREGLVVTYAGEGTVTLKLSTLNGDLWNEWVSFADYEAQFGAGVNELTEADCKIVTDSENHKTYLFGLEEGKFRIGVFDANNLLEYSGKVSEAGGTAAPVKVKSVTPENLRQKVWSAKETQTVSIEYESGLTKTEGAEIGVEIKVFSPFGVAVGENVQNGVKATCKIEEVTWSPATNKLDFKFTPSPLMRYNGLRYEFTPTNLTKEGVAPEACAVTFAYSSIVASKAFGGNNGLYTGNFIQPMLVNNGNAISSNVRNQLALAATKPVSDEQTSIDSAVKAYMTANANPKYNYQEGAFKSSSSYEVSLTADGQKWTPASPVKLALPYPEGCGPETANVAYQVFCFKRGDNGELDFANPEVIDPVKTRQGFIIETREFESVTVVALNSAKFQPPSDVTMYKTVLTQFSGVGGTIAANTNKTVNILGKIDDEVVYTLTAEIGYKLDFLTLNGNDQTGGSAFRTVTEGDETHRAVYEFKVIYGLLVTGSSIPSANNVFHAEFVAAGKVGKMTLANGAANNFVAKQLSSEKYTDEEKNEIVKDYPAGVAKDPGQIDPPAPVSTKSTQMQLIIVLSVLGAFAVIGIIVIIFCAVVRPKIIREREEEAARIAANRERRANRNRMQSMGALPRGTGEPPVNPNGRPPQR